VKTKIAFILNNEDGYFMIMATLMILVLLTILGVAASRTANTEIAVSANEMVYQRNFYMAEGALIEAIDILANSTDLADNPPDWFEPDAGNLTEANVDTYWDTTAEESSVDDTGNTRFPLLPRNPASMIPAIPVFWQAWKGTVAAALWMSISPP
jgi:Tfp pilus assembly protein PilX